MATITQERLAELHDMYERLKLRVLQVDEKYSLEYHEPTIDMPESLNLKKLTYTPKSESQLRQEATRQAAATIISKQRAVDSSYAAKLKSVSTKRAQLQLKYNTIFAELRQTYSENCDKLTRKLVNNGLLFSSLNNTERSKELSRFNQKNYAETERQIAETEIIDGEESAADNAYKAACASLEKEQAALADKAYDKSVEAEAKLKSSIDKYNNSLEEKEQKYQASRAKTLLSAQRAETERLQSAMKSYAELGETGYRNLICKQKYAICQDAFWPLRRSEAQTVLTFDSFLRTHLESYYTAFTDWINTALLPDNN